MSEPNQVDLLQNVSIGMRWKNDFRSQLTAEKMKNN